MLARYLPSSCVCSSVRLSVTSRRFTKMAKRRITQTTPYDSPGTIVFWRQHSLVGDAPFLLKFALKVTHPFQTQRFRTISANSALIVRASEKCSISTNRKTRFPTSTDEPCELPLSPPKGGTKRRFAVCFVSKIQLMSKDVCYKDFCVKTSSGKVVATLFLYLEVHRWIAGDVPIYLKFALKVTNPFRKRRFLVSYLLYSR